MKDDSNASQTWIRTRSKADRALKDLTTLADTLPDDKQDQIFSIVKISMLLDSILRQPIRPTSDFDGFDTRRSRLAAAMAERCLNKCIVQFEKFEKSEKIRNLVTMHLRDSIDLCRDIASKGEQQGFPAELFR